MAPELVYLGIAAVVIVVVLLLLRRASARSQAEAPKAVQDRLREVGVGIGPEEPTRRARRPRPDRRPAEPTVEPTEAALEAPPPPETAESAEARAAYKQGLAKTRGGFVAKIGKLFSKKQIDADVLGELEEVLFTADIGPRAADRIFQSVKGGLSRDDLTDPAKIWK